MIDSLLQSSLAQLIHSITFFSIQHTGLILLTPLILIIIFAIVIRKGRNLRSLFFRMICFLSLLLALSVPFKSKVSFLDSPHQILLIDISPSMSDEAIRDCANKASRLYPDSPLKIQGFDQGIKASAEFTLESLESLLSKRRSSLTNFEKSISELVLQSPGQQVLLCSDGRETEGDVHASLIELKRSAVKIFPLLPDARLLGPEAVRITSLTGPLLATVGENITFAASIENPLENPFAGKAQFYINGKASKSQDLDLKPKKELSINQVFSDLPAGLHKISIKIPGVTEERARWVDIKERPRLLVVHAKRSEMNLSENLLKTLGYEKDTIILGEETIPESLLPYSGVILNNIPERALSKGFQSKLKGFVENGGGLLILGGDSSFGLGGYAGSILEELSPLQSIPPRAKIKRLPSAIALVIDKSGSMNEQGRMLSARLAALSAINSLKDDDMVAIIGFDNAPLSVMELQKVSLARGNAEQRLRNLTAKGGTNLLPGLALARLRLSRAEAGKKHILVLSDGIFPHSSNSFVREINQIKSEGITMSTIALGLDADVPFLKMLAQTGKGTFYQVINPTTLPKIFMDDLKVATGEDTMKEQLDFPVAIGPSGILSSRVERFPFLKGFIETKSKPRAQLELITRKASETFPIFASWMYGTGKVFAFASDLQGRWSSPWIRWPEITAFWDDIFRKLKGTQESTTEDIKFDIRYQISGNVIRFELFLYEKQFAQIPAITSSLSSPLNKGSKAKSDFILEKKDPGRYEGSTILSGPGDYIVSNIVDKTPLPPIGISISPDELGEIRGEGINYKFLDALANETGGKLDPSPDDLIKFERKEIVEPRTFSWPFALLALILLVIEVIIRERSRKRR